MTYVTADSEHGIVMPQMGDVGQPTRDQWNPLVPGRSPGWWTSPTCVDLSDMMDFSNMVVLSSMRDLSNMVDLFNMVDLSSMRDLCAMMKLFNMVVLSNMVDLSKLANFSHSSISGTIMTVHPIFNSSSLIILSL
jgi:hypothetical protein